MIVKNISILIVLEYKLEVLCRGFESSPIEVQDMTSFVLRINRRIVPDLYLFAWVIRIIDLHSEGSRYLCKEVGVVNYLAMTLGFVEEFGWNELINEILLAFRQGKSIVDEIESSSPEVRL
jgi:hypothetical protein